MQKKKIFKKIYERKKVNTSKKSKEQKRALYNIILLNKARKEVIRFLDDYSSVVSETKMKPTEGTVLKILKPKQVLQRLPIALAGNNTESLLNEIRQIVYSLFQSKKSLKRCTTT